MAKVKIGSAGRFIGTQSVQLHGGMGMSQEYPIGHYYRRLSAIEAMFGNTAWHRARLGTLDHADMRAAGG
jgi:alkylation response protein AidB-like acyl-CoA dehydrogenase